MAEPVRPEEPRDLEVEYDVYATEDALPPFDPTVEREAPGVSGRPEELIAALRDAADSHFRHVMLLIDRGEPEEVTKPIWEAGFAVKAHADDLEAAGDGPFVIDATGAVLGTLDDWTHVRVEDLRLAYGPSGGGAAQAAAMDRVMAVVWDAGPLRPSLTEEPQDD